MLEYDSNTGTVEIVGYSGTIDDINEFTEQGKMNAYLEQAVLYSALPDSDREDVLKYMEMRGKSREETFLLQEYIPRAEVEIYQQELCERSNNDPEMTESEGNTAQYLGKKYKPIVLKVKPIYGDLPEKFRIKRDIKGDPLADMPELKPISPEFTPTG
jgi:hypothetical protein